MKLPELNQVLEMAWFPKRLQGTFPSADGNIGIIVRGVNCLRLCQNCEDTFSANPSQFLLPSNDPGCAKQQHTASRRISVVTTFCNVPPIRPCELSPFPTNRHSAFRPLFASPGNTLHTATSYSELGSHLYARMRSAAHVFYLAVFALLRPSHADGQTATKSRSQSPDTCAVRFQCDLRPVLSN